MHRNALDKVERKVEGSLRNCQVTDSWPLYDSFAIHVESLAAEVLKHKKEWLIVSDVFSIFYDLTYEALRATTKPPEELEGNLWDLLGEAEAQKLKKVLVEFYDSIPRDYDVYVPIPKLSVDVDSIAISDTFALVVFNKEDDIPGGYAKGLRRFDNKLEPKKGYFRYSIGGYCSGNLENITLKKALSKFKIAFQQGIAKDLMKITEGRPAGLGLLGGLTHYQFRKAKLVSVDKTSNAQRIVSTELPLDVSKLLDSLDTNLSEKVLHTTVASTNIAALFNSYFKLPCLLMENTTMESVRVKSAIEWCFDSYATENTTMSFLQTCIGLEALLGDDADGEALTRTLADRCAYLVGSDIRGRKSIRENFKELYSIRSKLVHGSATSLGADEQRYLNWGRNVLEYAIFKEIKHLAMEKQV